jgi:hypothetical protein
MTLLIMILLITNFSYNDVTYNRFYLKVTLLITVNKNKYVMSHLIM